MQIKHGMFVTVLAAALFSGVSTADSCTVFLPPLVGRGGECSASSELMNRIGQNCLCFAARGFTLSGTRPLTQVPS